ncbi:hypothetical protein VNO78_35260 [Psophocarpus tetragonolobus]
MSQCSTHRRTAHTQIKLLRILAASLTLGLFSESGCTQRSPTMSILSISSASTLDQQHQLVSTTNKMKKDSHDYDVRSGRVDEEIAMFHHKLKQIEDGVTFVGRTTKQARSLGKKIQSDARTTTLTHTIDGRRGSIHRRGGDFGIGSPVRRATALWLLDFSSSFLCNSLDQSPLVIGRPSRLAYDRRDSKG